MGSDWQDLIDPPKLSAELQAIVDKTVADMRAAFAAGSPVHATLKPEPPHVSK